MGQQFLPRIGQEVLVQFLENDIDRPVVVGALYNGQGEGGVAATPGGRRDRETDLSCFETAHDLASSAQANLSGGNSPVWHGASADSAGHRNSTSQWGIRNKEFGGYGYSQLLFDDIDGKGRVQLKSMHAGSELNLGQIIHNADNYRGSFRGTGAELRTDAYGAIRAASGLLLATKKIAHNTLVRDPAGDNAAGVALIKQLEAGMKSFNTAAVTHRTVDFAALLGTIKSSGSVLDDKASPLSAIVTSASAQVNRSTYENPVAEVHAKKTASSDDNVPHARDPLITISANDDYAMIAGKSLQLATGEAIVSASGNDTQSISGGQARVHTYQTIGLLGGAIKPPDGNHGVQLIAAKDVIDISAQHDHLSVQARDKIELFSITGNVDLATEKTLTLRTEGGASIKIDSGNILVQCPGKITIHAGKKSLTQPTRISYPFPALPMSICVECLLKARNAGSPFVLRTE